MKRKWTWTTVYGWTFLFIIVFANFSDRYLVPIAILAAGLLIAGAIKERP